MAKAEAQTPQSWKDCPLHNEGNDEDDSEDVIHFISVDHMCRDEQLFSSYFEELIREHGRPIVGNDAEVVDDCGANGVEVEHTSVNPSGSSIWLYYDL